jgi:hypothetical protein
MNRGCVAALDATPRAHVLVHCRGRLGRAIIVAASLLIELGMEPTKAFRTRTSGTTGSDRDWRSREIRQKCLHGTKVISGEIDGLV